MKPLLDLIPKFYISALSENAILELANPDAAYSYHSTAPDVWEFSDKYGNTLGVAYRNKEVFVYYKMRSIVGGDWVEVYDYSANKALVEPLNPGSDDHRSDTIAKIVLDEIIPKHLFPAPAKLTFRPLDSYRYDVFKLVCKVCCDRYPVLKISELGDALILVNRGSFK